MIEKETNNFEFAKKNSISKKRNIETAFKKFQKMPADANIIAKGYLWANSNCSKTVVTCENPLMILI